MKIFHKAKDGGSYSTVTGYWLLEAKRLFSIALLKFEDGSREEYHSHAFNSVSWVLRGNLREEHMEQAEPVHYSPSLRPVVTRRSTFHRVFSQGTSWVLTFRGPWSSQWKEFNDKTQTFSTLENGRKIVTEEKVTR